MKTDIHPTYYHDTKVVCACGNTFTTGSTKKEIRVEICSACHPFFTGQAKFIDTEGRVDKFMRKRDEAKIKSEEVRKRKEARATRHSKDIGKERPQTLRDMLKSQL